MSAPLNVVRDLLTFHFECLQGMYFSEQHRLNRGSLLFSDKIADPYYNFLAPDDPATALNLSDKITAEFILRDRQPALYLTPLAVSDNGAPDTRLEPWARDVWLIGDASALAITPPHPAGLRLLLIGESHRETYVETFAKAYSGDVPNDPYGQLDAAYTDCLFDSFEHDVDGYRKYYLLATVDDVPAGVACMFTSGDTAAVYGVGTVATHRRNGLGTAMMARLAQIAAQDAAGRIMLQTEAGSVMQRWYERLGYQQAFTAGYYELSPDPDS